MKKTSAILAFLTIMTVFGYSGFYTQASTGKEMTITGFDLNPKTVLTGSKTIQLQMTFTVSVSLADYNNTCGSNVNTFNWSLNDVTKNVPSGGGSDNPQGVSVLSGTATFERTSTPTKDLSGPITFNPYSVNHPVINAGGTVGYRMYITCDGNFGLGHSLTDSGTPVTITFGSSTNVTSACVGPDNKYVCSKNATSDCSDIPATANCKPNSCIKIGVNLCLTDAGNVGTGSPTTNPVDATAPQKYTFNITNPISGGPSDILGLINIITQWILQISIPLAVLMILWAGFLMLTAGATPANFQKGKSILTYTVIGLTIIFIGKGFISLIYSILEPNGTGTTTTQQQTNPLTPNTPTTSGSLGSVCQNDNNCQAGFTCQQKNGFCDRPNGNNVGEACTGDVDCTSGLTCAGHTTIVDGKTLGTCIAPSN